MTEEERRKRRDELAKELEALDAEGNTDDSTNAEAGAGTEHPTETPNAENSGHEEPPAAEAPATEAEPEPGTTEANPVEVTPPTQEKPAHDQADRTPEGEAAQEPGRNDAGDGATGGRAERGRPSHASERRGRTTWRRLRY